ncbi:MAG: hypothetical protein K8R99_09780 [Actinomycetia bacterium]|nr:hypothetical protein [Actinomycetes bacterium]
MNDPFDSLRGESPLVNPDDRFVESVMRMVQQRLHATSVASDDAAQLTDLEVNPMSPHPTKRTWWLVAAAVVMLLAGVLAFIELRGDESTLAPAAPTTGSAPAETVATLSTVPIEVIEGAPPNWPYRSVGGDPAPAIEIPNPADIASPAEGGDLAIEVSSAEVRRENELEAMVGVSLRVTNMSEGSIESGPGRVHLWCNFPVSELGVSQYPPETAAVLAGLPEFENFITVEPQQTVEFAVYVRVNLPLTNCAPRVAMEIPQARADSDSAATVRDQQGDLWLVPSIDIPGLLDAAAPIPEGVPSIIEMCRRVESAIPELFPDEANVVRSGNEPCAWSSDSGDLVDVSLHSGFQPLVPYSGSLTYVSNSDLPPGALEAEGVADLSYVRFNSDAYTLVVAARGDTQVARAVFALVTALNG